MSKDALEADRRLESEKILWIATVRANGKPHLVPIWFVWDGGNFNICIEPGSVKARNLRKNPCVAVSLEDGKEPIICEGVAELLPGNKDYAWPAEVVQTFKQKYDWDILTEDRYTQLVAIKPEKWLSW